jgi:uncharacterized cupin superfamily protein
MSRKTVKGRTMTEFATPIAINAWDVPGRQNKSIYPEPFASRMVGRTKRALGDLFGLKNFGVVFTTLAPGAASALRHAHSVQDEFIYVVEGTLVLHTDEGETVLTAGMCAGFRAGTGNGHRLINRSDQNATMIEVGDRTAGENVNYPDEDLVAKQVENGWQFFHKDGTPY